MTPEQIAAWQPDPPNADQLDHLMVTPNNLIATMKPNALKHIERMSHMLEGLHRFQRGDKLLSLESLEAT